MINILRKNQKALWIVIALLCIPFVFYFSNTPTGPVVDNEFGTLYGRTITNVEAQRNARMLNLARELGMFTYLQDMIAGAQSEEQAYNDFTWNRLILRHEAERLGIAPSGTEVANVIKNLRPFRGDKGFDINKYNEFTKNMLPPMGFSEGDIEQIVGEQLALDRIKEIVGTGVHIPEAEAKENYERAYGKLNVAVVRVQNEEIANGAQITAEDIQKYYEAHKAELKSEEKRKVSFVTFGLNEEQKKLAGKERVDVLQKLADGAGNFNQAVLDKAAPFDQLAAKFQLPIQTTGDFTKAAPDPLLGPNPQLSAAAFALTPQEPTSDAIQAGDSFYVLHLSGIDEAKPLTFDEARPKVIEALKAQKVRELVAARGAEASQKIREALKNGMPVEAALQQTGLPMEKLPPFALADPPPMSTEPGKPAPPQAPDLSIIKSAASELNPGEASDFTPTPAGGVITVLEKRDAPDAAAYEQAKATFVTRFERGKREVAFYEWMRERRREAGVQEKAEPTIEPVAG